jgi:type I restriction enzyme S subunit
MKAFPLRPFSHLVDINPGTKLLKDVEHPFVAMEDVTPGRRYVHSRQQRNLAGGARFEPADTLLARITPCLENGKIAQYDPTGKPGFGSTEFIVLRAKPGIADPGFIHYLAVSKEIREPAILSMAGASGRQRADAKVVAEALVPAPLLATQRRIAGILGAYDDLIEVNRRRIVVLEEMARALFTEWFIHLRFPGHEGVTIIVPPDGPLPVGWSWGTAGDLLLFDPRTRVPREGEKPFIPMGYLDTSTSLIAEPEARAGNSGAKFQNGDTLFARISPCLENGKTGLVRNLPGPDGVGFGSTEFIVMRGGRAGPAFSYCLSRLPVFRDHATKSMSGATGRQRARTNSVADFPIAIPPTNSLLERFEKVAWPMLELVGQIGLSNARLAAARDLLLPRIISGHLSVAQAAREMETA